MAWESSLPTEDKILKAHCKVSSGVMDTKLNSVKIILPTEEKISVYFTFKTQSKTQGNTHT